MITNLKDFKKNKLNESASINPISDYAIKLSKMLDKSKRYTYQEVIDKLTSFAGVQHSTEINAILLELAANDFKVEDKEGNLIEVVPEPASRKSLNKFKESAKLDKVGEEDEDINNDGKEDQQDKYLLNRRKAIKKSILTKEAYQFDFEDWDNSDIAGSAMEMDIDNLIEETKQLVEKEINNAAVGTGVDIDKVKTQAYRAIRQLWIEKINLNLK